MFPFQPIVEFVDDLAVIVTANQTKDVEVYIMEKVRTVTSSVVSKPAIKYLGVTIDAKLSFTD